MAIYHCSISNVSRAKGASSVASYAYISGDKVTDETRQKTYTYARQERVMCVKTILPASANPEWQGGRLWNEVEKAEKAVTARTAKKIEVALPVEFDLNKQKQVVEDFIKENFTDKGYCASYAIHCDKENKNPHAHILVANRQLDEKGQWKSKNKKVYVLDEKGERVPLLDENGNQKLGKRNEKLWKRESVEVNLLDKKETLKEIRASWAGACNRYLEQEQQIDHRSNVARNIDAIPTVHEGYASKAIEARTGRSERSEMNKEIKQANTLLEAITAKLERLKGKVKVIMAIARGWMTKQLRDPRAKQQQRIVNGVDVTQYVNRGYNRDELKEICLGLEAGLDVSIYADLKFNAWQMEELRKGLEAGLDVSAYADPDLSFLEMRSMREDQQREIKASREDDREMDWER